MAKKRSEKTRSVNDADAYLPSAPPFDTILLNLFIKLATPRDRHATETSQKGGIPSLNEIEDDVIVDVCELEEEDEDDDEDEDDGEGENDDRLPHRDTARAIDSYLRVELTADLIVEELMRILVKGEEHEEQRQGPLRFMFIHNYCQVYTS